jgi:hypothetical protein
VNFRKWDVKTESNRFPFLCIFFFFTMLHKTYMYFVTDRGLTIHVIKVQHVQYIQYTDHRPLVSSYLSFIWMDSQCGARLKVFLTFIYTILLYIMRFYYTFVQLINSMLMWQKIIVNLHPLKNEMKGPNAFPVIWKSFFTKQKHH